MSSRSIASRRLLGLLVCLLSASAVASFTAATPRTPREVTVTLLCAHKGDDINNRRNFIATTAAATSILVHGTAPPSALAKSGDSASMKVPGIGSYIDFLIEKNAEQQGTDQSVMLYKGADLETQLRRLSDAANRLTEIRNLAEDKKWSQVQGVITGPLGTLLQTMNTVVSASGGDKKVKDAAGKVKGDVIAIGQAATQKSVEGCIKAADAAMADLEAFVKIAFE